MTDTLGTMSFVCYKEVSVNRGCVFCNTCMLATIHYDDGSVVLIVTRFNPLVCAFIKKIFLLELLM